MKGNSKGGLNIMVSYSLRLTYQGQIKACMLPPYHIKHAMQNLDVIIPSKTQNTQR